MSAAELREAAALMRQRAEAATPGRWNAGGMWWFPVGEVDDEGRFVERSHGFHAVTDDATGAEMVTLSTVEAHAEHIASWHPAVALAVADWLEQEAEFDERLREHGARGLSDDDPARVVARAYLGRTS